MQKRQATAPGGSRQSRRASVTNADEIFSKSGRKVDYKGNTEDAPKYFQQRINSQNNKKRNNSYFDGVVRKTSDPLGEITKQQLRMESHNHLNSFLRDQIMRKQAKNQNSYDQDSATGSRKNLTTNVMGSGATTGKDLGGMVMVSGYQSDPLAATLNQRSIGLSKLNVTQKQIDDDNHLFDRTYNVRGGVGILHQTP